MNNRIEQTINEARDKGIARISTCNAPNWNREEHDGMLMLVRNQPEDVEITFKKSYDVYDWTLIRIGEKNPSPCHIHETRDTNCYLCSPKSMAKKAAHTYSLNVDFDLLHTQKQGLMYLLAQNPTANEEYQIEGLLAVIDSIQDQAVDNHGMPEKEVFKLAEVADEDIIDFEDAVEASERAAHLINTEITKTFDAYQHFLYYIDVNHLREVKPWGEHMTEHFLGKLKNCEIGTIVSWVQEMSHHNQDALIAYMRRYHTGKGGGFRTWK